MLTEICHLSVDPHPGNLLATTSGDLVYLDFGMMSEAPQSARYAIIQHVVHLVNRDYAVSSPLPPASAQANHTLFQLYNVEM